MARRLGGPGSQLGPFAEILQAGVPQTAEAITERIWQEIPSYAALGDSGERERVRKAAARNVAAFVGALAEGKELSEEQIHRLGVVGEERAAQGVPLEDVMRAFRMVGRVLWEHLGRQLSNTPNVPMDTTLRLGEALMRFTDRLSSAVAQHYYEAQRSILNKEEVARRDFFSDLILGSYSSLDAMIETARGFGYDLLRHHFAIVATCEDPDISEEAALTEALARTTEDVSPSGRPLVGRRGGQTIALFGVPPRAQPKASEVGDALLADLGTSWRIGVGGPHPGLEGCRRSYLEAKEAVEIGCIVD
ncbi:MAG: PucR family transcriptional regulator, partial [Actinomycetota bacterium]